MSSCPAQLSSGSGSISGWGSGSIGVAGSSGGGTVAGSSGAAGLPGSGTAGCTGASGTAGVTGAAGWGTSSTGGIGIMTVRYPTSVALTRR